MNFRRYYIPDSAVFIIQVVESRRAIFRDQKFIEVLRATLRKVKEYSFYHAFIPDLYGHPFKKGVFFSNYLVISRQF